MANPFGHKSEKYEKIDKENARIVASVGGTVFLVIFSLFAAQALISQSLYQNRVISEKKTALKQLEENKEAADDLRNVYSAFVSESENVLGGSPTGKSSVDGDNAKIVLDALPGEYDYPGLSSSIEKILVDGGYTIESIGGSEDATLAGSTDSSAPVNIPYPFAVSASSASMKELLQTLEKSIRPFYVDTMTIRSSQAGLRTSLGVRTFYQPEVIYELGTKVVR